MKCIIAGSREGFDYYDVVAAVRASGWEDEITEVVSGAARGVDTWGEQWAKGHSIAVKRFPVTIEDWKRRGKAAGPLRNYQMALYADALIALWDGKSKGTGNMIETAKARGLRVFVYQPTRS